MNCRRINSLLSAYLDSELTGSEMLAIREHLRDCPTCEQEYESLKETKRLIASLAFRAPRAELEALLLQEAERAESSFSVQGAVSRLLQWLGGGATAAPSSPAGATAGGSGSPFYLRPRPLAATALLTLAGLWLASVSLETPPADADRSYAANSVVTFDPPSAATVSPTVGVAALPPPAVVVGGMSSGSSPYAQASMTPGLGTMGLGSAVTGVIMSPNVGSTATVAASPGNEWSSASSVNTTLILMARRYVTGR